MDDAPPQPPSAVLAGRVVVSGPLRGARLSIEQVDPATGDVRVHVADTTTDEEGAFSLELGLANGLLRATARGGSFVDLATGATIQLDATDALSSLVWFELGSHRDDALVSPIGHLVDARARATFGDHGDLARAMERAREHLHRHFGNADWSRLRLVGLDEPATSPTEAVRAALVQASLSYLARDIAAEAGASPQEVNVYALTQRWAEDLAAGPFDGNDGNDRAPGSGLQLGVCPPVVEPCEPPAAGCAIGACRRLCDLYVGTPRVLLGAVMTKVIRDNGPGGVNQTGLGLGDTLAIARDVSDNRDADLFGDACGETLDRVPPVVRFDAPAEAALVRGVLAVRVSAIDDTDPSPRAAISGYPDADGDPTNASALAMIETTTLPDGPLALVATATDLAGNTATAQRTVAIDNTAPQLAIAPDGFLVDGATWWTATETPVLRGTVTDASPVTIKVVAGGGIEVTATVTGSTWQVGLPAGSLDAAGTQVSVVAVDAVGNQSSIGQRIRPDVAAPSLSFQSSAVSDEASEPVEFGSETENPTHSHTGPSIDLTAVGACPVVTKHSYLLGAAAPPYAVELPARNPILYQFVTADDGVGIASGSTQYRVGRRSGGSTQWILDWTPTGTGAPIATGVTRFAVGVYSNVVPGLATTPGVYDVEFRATDRLSRTSTTARCFELRLKAPPLHFGIGGPPSADPAQSHTYALDSLSLAHGAPFDLLARRLLNADATGASLIDQPVVNGTAETVYLTVTVSRRPVAVRATRSFVIENAITAVTTVNVPCSELTSDCEPPASLPRYASASASTDVTSLAFPAKVFELVNGVPTTEVPCIAPCAPTDSVFRFAIPPRAPGNQPPRRFLVMTMIGQISSLWPTDASHPASPPFADESIDTVNPYTDVATTVRITGLVDRTVVPARTGCVRTIVTPGGTSCRRRGTIVPYRALNAVSLEFQGATETMYATAVTLPLAPVPATPAVQRTPKRSWSTIDSLLP
ncbi:MAG: hypothetical protein ACTHU0_05170 [Kofleriaceae bacterium]